jgi:serine/threonine protein phosphatase PrpC
MILPNDLLINQKLPQYQEDAHVVDLDVDGTGSTALFGVFDGHAGAEVAAFCARHIVCRPQAHTIWDLLGEASVY